MKQRILSLLVLLVAAVSGAWALDAVPAFNLSVAESDNGSGTISYTVQDKDDPEKITENAKGANEGDLVTVTVTADKGYVVGSVTASTNNTWEAAGAPSRRAPAAIPMLGDVTLTPVEGKANTWTFTMPAANVEVKVGYVVASYLFLSKEALKDKASIAVTAGETTVEFDDAGKSTTTVTKGSTVTATYTGTKKIMGVDAKIYDPIATPLTLEVTATGGETSTIRINIDGTLTTGMKYSVNGGEKKIVTASTNIENLNVGDKVQFYGNGTETQMYGYKDQSGALVKIAGGSAKVKAYGNIMSLVNETGFATTTTTWQLQARAFYSLFKGNTNLVDASDLLLPATTLNDNCYEGMFYNCSNLTAGPKELPATTAATRCYAEMFRGCGKLTAAPKMFFAAPTNYICLRMFYDCSSLKDVYIKAASSGGNSPYTNMFYNATATGAVLHTTSDNAGGWNGKCGSWSVQGDWPATAAPTTWTVVEPSVISADWNAATKTGTFTMPGNDVELIPNFAPTAQFAVVSNMAQLPAAAEGIYAATSAPLITAGTAVEGQGKVMYLATTDDLTADQAKAASGWSETLPTAEGFAENTKIAYVWYYIQATDAYNDSEPVCIPITFPDNKFNLTLNAANAYTIDATQASKGTVTVAGTDKTSAIAEGKLNAVTVGSEVKLTAATGYKFRKVEVKNDSKDPLATPMTIKALTDGTIVVYNAIRYTYGIKYSVNGGDKSVMDQATYTINVNAGDEVQFYGNGTNITDYGYINEDQNIDKTVIGGTAKMKVFGNIMSLLNEENFATNTELPNPSQSSYFWKLFNENTNLTDASGLLLPSTTLATYCYGGLFYGCTSLTAGPELPATQMAKDCYSDMFNGCTSLTKAPKLPATTLAEKCYFRMFRSCTSLTSVYVKAGYAAAQRECSSMFDGTSTAAVLHTTSGSQSSWQTMMGTGKTWDSWTVSADWTE